MTLERRTGAVTAVNSGPPATVTIQVGGDTATTYDAPYLDSYDPDPGDVVQVLSESGYHVVIGRAAANPRRVWNQLTSNVSPITTSEVNLVVLPTLVVDGVGDVRLDWSWDSFTGAVGAAGARLGLRVKASLNGGAFATVGRTLLRCTVDASAEGGGSGYLRIAAPAAGSWVYKMVGINEGSPAGTFTVNAGTGAVSPMTFSAERVG